MGYQAFQKGILRVPFFVAGLVVANLLTASLPAQPRAEFTPAMKEAFRYVTEMRFDQARQMLSEAETTDPTNRVPQYLEAAMLCVEAFVSEDEARFEHQKKRLGTLIDGLAALPEEEPLRQVFLGEIYLAQAILNGKFKNNFTAAWQFYKSYDLLTRNHREHPDFRPNYIALGTLYAALGSLPDDYRKLASLLGFKGDVSEGLRLLASAHSYFSEEQDWKFYRPYAGFVYIFVKSELDPGERVSPQQLGLPVAESPFLIYLQARIDLQEGRPEAAAGWLAKRPQGPSYLPFPYLDYLEGKVLLGLEPNRARQALERYLQNARGKSYRKSTYRYLSWLCLLEGDTAGAQRMRERVFREGHLLTGADQQAQLEAGRPLNHTLIQARVWFDAARYDAAQKLLAGTDVSRCCARPHEWVEYHYRLGRILQEQEQMEKAAEAFQKAFEYTEDEASFARGNSALQMGLIHEEGGRTSLAIQWYQRCLAIGDYPFYEGVHQKAKAGLARTGR